MSSIAFDITTGQMREGGRLFGIGYAGRGEAANDASRCREAGVGPLPPGRYLMRSATTEEVKLHKKGPSFIWLEPVPDPSLAHMFGRSGFLVHWDNGLLDFTGSEGCIVLWSWVAHQSLAAAISRGATELEVFASTLAKQGASK